MMYNQLPLFSSEFFDIKEKKALSRSNNLLPEDRSFHDWYRFVLSFPPHLVRYYLKDFHLNENATILDPFCGTGTTLVEAKKNRIRGIGFEANPFPQFASSVKTDWSLDPDELIAHARKTAERTLSILKKQEINDNVCCIDPGIELAGIELNRLSPDSEKLLISDSISPLPLHKTLVLIDSLPRNQENPTYPYLLLALGNALVNAIGNLRFGPEVGVGKKKTDVPVISAWMAEIEKMAKDLKSAAGRDVPDIQVHLADARQLHNILTPESIDGVITSPPYPNEKDYTRTTRLESVILGFYKDSKDLREYKKNLLRSNTRGVYKADDDDRWVDGFARIQEIADAIEKRRIELKKTSGFEKQYARVTKLYFGGMARHLSDLRTVLRPGAKLAYVVGDQASYLKIMIRTGELLAEIAESLGYKVERIDLFRTRFATATKCHLREEVLVLQWPG